MLNKEYIEDLVKKIGEDISDEKSYSHKPHLAGLPYDRRSTSWDELRERYNACISEQDKRKEQMDNLREVLRQDLVDFKKSQKDLDESVEKLKEWSEDNQKFFDADKPVLEEKREWMNNVMDTVNFDIVLPDNLRKELDGLNDYYFNDNYPTSFLNEAEQNEFIDLAGRIVDFAYEQTGGDDTAWSNQVIGVADDLRILARNDYFSENLESLHDNAHNIGEMSGLQDHINIMQKETDVRRNGIKTTKKELDKLFNEWQDFADERGRVADRCVALGLV